MYSVEHHITFIAVHSLFDCIWIPESCPAICQTVCLIQTPNLTKMCKNDRGVTCVNLRVKRSVIVSVSKK